MAGLRFFATFFSGYGFFFIIFVFEGLALMGFVFEGFGVWSFVLVGFVFQLFVKASSTTASPSKLSNATSTIPGRPHSLGHTLRVERARRRRPGHPHDGHR